VNDSNLSETVLLSLGEIKGLLTGAIDRTTKLEERVGIVEGRVWKISGGLAVLAVIAEQLLQRFIN
jgi:hypothetical protein